MPSNLFFVLLWVLILAWFGYILWRGAQGRRRHQEMIASLEPGDEVVTSGGVLGTVRRIERERVQLEVAPNVQLWLVKGAIAGRQPSQTQRRAA